MQNGLLSLLHTTGKCLTCYAIPITPVLHSHCLPRLLPEITLLEAFKGKMAKELVKKCPMKVFDIEDSGKLFIACLVPFLISLCRQGLR